MCTNYTRPVGNSEPLAVAVCEWGFDGSGGGSRNPVFQCVPEAGGGVNRAALRKRVCVRKRSLCFLADTCER
ncbi:unnamed protein product [Caretta caretta]